MTDTTSGRPEIPRTVEHHDHEVTATLTRSYADARSRPRRHTPARRAHTVSAFDGLRRHTYAAAGTTWTPGLPSLAAGQQSSPPRAGGQQGAATGQPGATGTGTGTGTQAPASGGSAMPASNYQPDGHFHSKADFIDGNTLTP